MNPFKLILFILIIPFLFSCETAMPNKSNYTPVTDVRDEPVNYKKIILENCSKYNDLKKNQNEEIAQITYIKSDYSKSLTVIQACTGKTMFFFSFNHKEHKSYIENLSEENQKRKGIIALLNKGTFIHFKKSKKLIERNWDELTLDNILHIFPGRLSEYAPKLYSFDSSNNSQTDISLFGIIRSVSDSVISVEKIGINKNELSKKIKHTDHLVLDETQKEYQELISIIQKNMTIGYNIPDKTEKNKIQLISPSSISILSYKE